MQSFLGTKIWDDRSSSRATNGPITRPESLFYIVIISREIIEQMFTILKVTWFVSREFCNISCQAPFQMLDKALSKSKQDKSGLKRMFFRKWNPEPRVLPALQLSMKDRPHAEVCWQQKKTVGCRVRSSRGHRWPRCPEQYCAQNGAGPRRVHMASVRHNPCHQRKQGVTSYLPVRRNVNVQFDKPERHQCNVLNHFFISYVLHFFSSPSNNCPCFQITRRHVNDTNM